MALYTDDREQTYSDYSDFYKSVYGVRPRWMYDAIMTMSEEEIAAAFARLSVDSEAAIEADRKAEQDAINRFNRVVAEYISIGANDRKTALRWMCDAHNVIRESKQDVEHFVWQHGFLFTEDGKALVNEIYNQNAGENIRTLLESCPA